MRKFTFTTIFATILTLFSLNASKAEEVYFGIDYLNNEVDSGVTNISSTLDEEDSGYSLYGGIPLNENLSIEISYQDFGEASLSGNSGNQFKVGTTTYEFTTTATLSVSAESIGYALVPKMPISDNISLYGKLGFHYWDSTFSVTSTNTTASLDDDGNDVFYGFGAEMNFGNLKGRIGYSLFDLDGDDIDSTNIGISFGY